MAAGWLRILVLSVATFCALELAPASASSAIHTDMAFYEDLSVKMTLSEVEGLKLTPFLGNLPVGYGSSAVWIKIKVSGHSAESNEKLVLKVTPIYLDEIDIFQNCNGNIIKTTIGDQFPADRQSYIGTSLNLALETCAFSNPIWLRIQSTSTRSSYIAVEPFRQAMREDSNRFAIVILSAAVIVIFIGFIIAYGSTLQDKIFQFFCLQQASLLAVLLLNHGIERVLFNPPPAFSDRAQSFFVIFSALAGMIFNIALLQSFSISRLMRPSALILMIATTINLLLVFGSWRSYALTANAIIIAVSIVFFFAMTLTIHETGDKPNFLSKKIIVSYYAAVTALMTLPILSVFGLRPTFVPDIATVYSSFTTIVMSTILFFRARTRASQNEKIKFELEIRNQKLEQVEKFRDQQDQLFSMLVHEVKTPIAALSIALRNSHTLNEAREKARRHLETITSIINRCNQANRLEDPAFDVVLSRVQLQDIIWAAIDSLEINVEMEANITDEITTDPQLLEIVLGNLFDNACRYKLRESTPQLIVRRENRGACPGIALDIHNEPGVSGVPDPSRLFSKYYRSESARHISGSGLGLYLAEKLTSKIGGTLDYSFSDGKVRFTVWIPS